MLTLGHVLEALTGYQSGGGALIITDVVIDPRLAIPGALFIALPVGPEGERGSVQAAFDKGASAALVQGDADVPSGDIPSGDVLPGSDPAPRCRVLDLREPVTYAHVAGLEPPICLRVEDTLKAMQTLAANWRSRLQPRVIGVTGSVGKTTTKELIAAVLSTRYRTFKTEGNFKPEIGLPLMLLKLTEAHERAVLEMGFDRPGEIKLLAEMARPHVGVVTNVYAVHLERAGSLEGLARGKAELVEALPPAPEGIAVLNADDPLVRAMGDHTRARVITYGLDPLADVWADNIESAGLDGIRFHLHYRYETLHVRVPLLGRHSVHTALRAAAVGLMEGLSWQEILDGLQAVGATQLRLVAVTGPRGSVILDDTYSASPESVIAALNLLNELEGRHVAVLGDMLELGSQEELGHRLVGRRARDVAHLLVTVGPLARFIAQEARDSGLAASAVVELTDSDAAIEFLSRNIRPGDVVLLKGSQGVKLDRVVPALEVRP